MQTTGNGNFAAMAVEPREKRRRRSKQERREIVEETLTPGASVAVIARGHGVNANQVFHWRKLYSQGLLELKAGAGPLLPVRIADGVNDAPKSARHSPGTIHIELDRARIRVEGSADPATLRTILEQLSR